MNFFVVVVRHQNREWIRWNFQKSYFMMLFCNLKVIKKMWYKKCQRNNSYHCWLDSLEHKRIHLQNISISLCERLWLNICNLSVVACALCNVHIFCKFFVCLFVICWKNNYNFDQQKYQLKFQSVCISVHKSATGMNNVDSKNTHSNK